VVCQQEAQGDTDQARDGPLQHGCRDKHLHCSDTAMIIGGWNM
jgi:hypothetical protein